MTRPISYHEREDAAVAQGQKDCERAYELDEATRKAIAGKDGTELWKQLYAITSELDEYDLDVVMRESSLADFRRAAKDELGVA